MTEPCQTALMHIDVQRGIDDGSHNTALLPSLRENNIRRLVVTGFVTNNSIESTVKNAGDLGFECFVVTAATACFDKEGIDGTIYHSSLIHQVSLSNLEGEFCINCHHRASNSLT